MEKKLNLVMKIFDGSIITLNRSGKINFINKSAEKILNRRQEQILGSTLEETIPPLAVFAPRLGSAKEGEAAKEEMPVKDRIITFEEQLLSISVYPLSDPEGISGHLILINRFRISRKSSIPSAAKSFPVVTPPNIHLTILWEEVKASSL